MIKDDIISFLSKENFGFDIIVAADVLTYFGALDSIINLVKKSLNNEGIFAFSISQNSLNQKEFFLTPSSRFVHTLSYVKKVLQNNDFAMLKIEDKVLRTEGGKDIKGYIIMAQKNKKNLR